MSEGSDKYEWWRACERVRSEIQYEIYQLEDSLKSLIERMGEARTEEELIRMWQETIERRREIQLRERCLETARVKREEALKDYQREIVKAAKEKRENKL